MKKKSRKTNGLSKLLIVLLAMGIIAIAGLLLLNPSLTFFSISSSENGSDSGNIIDTNLKTAPAEEPAAAHESSVSEAQETNKQQSNQEGIAITQSKTPVSEQQPASEHSSKHGPLQGVSVSASKNPSGNVGVQFSGSGSGTLADPYQITNWTQLAEVENNLGANYTLLADLSSSTPGYAGIGNSWYPIGFSHYFTGSFNGNHHTVSDVIVNMPSDSEIGFFSYGEYGCSISDLGVLNISVSCADYCGGFIGDIEDGCSVTNCYAAGTVTSTADPVGGLVGYVYSSDISNSYFIGDVSGEYSAGGLIGNINDGATGSQISDSYSMGTVAGTVPGSSSGIGGFVGYLEGNTGFTIARCFSTSNVSGFDQSGAGFAGDAIGPGTIQDCYATGSVSGKDWAGGFVGRVTDTIEIVNSYSTGDVTATGSNVGGFAGNIQGSPDDNSIDNSYSTGSVSGGANTGGFIGIITYNPSGYINNDGWWSGAGPGNAIANPAGSITYAEADPTIFYADAHGVYTAGSPVWNFPGIWMERNNRYPLLRWQMCPFSGSGSGTPGDPYQITSWTQLDQVRCNLSASYILMNDLSPDDSDYSEFNSAEGWTPIGNCGPADECWAGSPDYSYTFRGSLNGSGHNITGLYAHPTGSYPEESYLGLFGAVHGADIHNIGLVDVDIAGDYGLGGLVGVQFSGGSIYQSFSTGTVSGSESVGGLAGYSEGTIEDCYSTAAISGGGIKVGGFVGSHYGTISNAYSTGTVSGDDKVGGFAGESGGTISNAYSTGTVSGSTNKGGFLGSYGDWAPTINDCGWWSSAGPSNAIGNPAGSVTYPESLKSAFYNKNLGIYSSWDFVNIWVNRTNDFPIFGLTGEEEEEGGNETAPPNVTNFGIMWGSTNFSAVVNLRNVSNVTLANQYGKIVWNDFVSVFGQNFDANVWIDVDMAFVNSSALNSTLNSSANITLYQVTISGVDCNHYILWFSNQYTSSAADIIHHGSICTAFSDPTCTNKVCNGGNLTFTVSHFTGFAVSLDSSLGIWDSNDTGSVINALQNATFYANYTNLTNGESINGTNKSCAIKFKILSSWTQLANMTFNSTSKLYEYNKAFSNYGTYTWNVSCNDLSGSFANLQATDTIIINGTDPQSPGGAGNGGTGGSGGAGGNKGNVNATLPDVVAINLTVPVIDFGNMTPGEQKVNLTGIRIQNDGTLRINVDIGATDLWSAAHSFPGDNYLFKIGDAGEGGPESGTFDSSSLMDWTQMFSTAQLAIYNLNIVEAHDIAAVQVNLTVPFGEAAGLKVSTVTLTAYSI